MDVVASPEQTRLPARSAGPRTGEPRGTSSRWLPSKYTVEKAICSARGQVIVVAFVRMSTVWFCTAGIRSGSVTRRKSALSGSPTRSRTTSREMSTRKPSNSPVTGSRKLSGLLFWSMPTTTRPRRRIASTVGPGSVDGRKLAVASQLSTAAPDTDGATSAPLGIGSVVSEADTSASGCTVEQPATSDDCKCEDGCDRYASVVLAQPWCDTGSHRQRRQHTDRRRADREQIQRGVGPRDPVALPFAQSRDVVP